MGRFSTYAYGTIKQFGSFFTSKGGSRAETGGEAWGLDEVEILVSDEGGFDNAWL